jgi:2'-5' RNA ligase
MEQVRSFIAIELPDELKEGLSKLQSNLKRGNQYGVKWVNPYSIHLTLKFLGDVTANRLDEIMMAMEEAAQGIPPFHLEVSGPGVFPDPKRVQVAWVGLKGDLDQLGQLQKRIDVNLAQLGFEPERRAFTPHLTLARLRSEVLPVERQRFGQLIVETKFELNYHVEVESINLMRSQLTREGAIYTRIGSVKLKKPLSTPGD